MSAHDVQVLHHGGRFYRVVWDGETAGYVERIVGRNGRSRGYRTRMSDGEKFGSFHITRTRAVLAVLQRTDPPKE